MNRRLFVFLVANVCVITASCIQPITNHYEASIPVTPVIVDEPIEPEKIKEDIVLKPIPVYPAYLQRDKSTIWGVPKHLQGITHREKVQLETVDGLPVMCVSFFVDRGIAYITHEYTTDDGKAYTDFYAQDLSSNTPSIGLVDSIPNCPPLSRITLDSPEWLIETSVVSGVEYSYLYNRHAAVWGGAGKGEWICRKQSITEFVVLDKGILIECEDGIRFCPSNRKSLSEVDEKVVRLWK